jgi:hypothetical protein
MMDTFRQEVSQLEVTSLHRPDTGWIFVDHAGHAHRWHVAGEQIPATAYNPRHKYEVPTLVWVKDGEEYWEDDDEPHDVGHTECRVCGEHISPRSKPDDCQQFIPGLRRCYINDQPVSADEYDRRVHLLKDLGGR